MVMFISLLSLEKNLKESSSRELTIPFCAIGGQVTYE